MSWDNSVFDLSNWKLTLPVDDDYFEEDGGDGDYTDDEAAQIYHDQLEGLEVVDAFEYDEQSNAIIFSAAIGGASTSGSEFARSELREVDEAGENAAWSVNDTFAHTLSATLYVEDTGDYANGDPGRVIVGQIHSKDDELVRLYYNTDGTMYFANEHTGTDGEETRFYFENANEESPDISFLETFSYAIRVNDGQLTVAIYADGDTYEAVGTTTKDGTLIQPTAIIDHWDDEELYFKAGAFNQITARTNSDEYGTGSSVVGFYNIDVNDNVSSGDGAWLGDSLDNTGNSTQTGTSSNDILGGTSSDDSIISGAGNDILYGYAGNDTLSGQAGDDTLYAGTGNNELHGGSGADLFVVSDAAGTVTITDFALSDMDRIDLEDVFEYSDGFIEGAAWDAGYITLKQVDNSTYVYANLNGGSGGADVGTSSSFGSVVAILKNVTAADLSTSDFILINDPETRVFGSDVDDVLHGTSFDDSVKGYDGDDEIYGYAGDDSLWGGADNDTIHGGDGGDSLKANDGNDLVFGEEGDDSINGDANEDTLYGGNGDDYIRGGTGNDFLYGEYGNDSLDGQNGDDTLYAGNGQDSLRGGGGADDFVFTSLDTTGTIEDFSRSKGDQVDLSAILQDATGFVENTAFDDGYVVMSQSGKDTHVYVDLDGIAGKGNSSLVAVLTDIDISNQIDDFSFILA